jgi:hypothetical protein
VTLRDIQGLDVLRVHDQVDKVLDDGERALDQTLADSFPASDPPPWTLGVAHRDSKPDAIARQLATLAGAIGVALLVPVAILVVGLPVVLFVRGILEAVTWLMTSVLR